MAIKAILLDRDREVFPLLGDIFNVTSHKLLIATSDEMFNELIQSTEVDVVMLNHTDVKIWLSAWKEENIPLPFFLLDREEEELKFKLLGFSDLNYIKKPFNPLELLNKLSYLHRLQPSDSANQLGLVNTIIKLANSKGSAIVEVSNSKSCLIAIEKGEVLGMDCTMEELRSILESEDLKVNTKRFEAITTEQSFAGTYEFIKTLMEKVRPVPAVVSKKEATEDVKLVEEVGEGVYRVSRFSTVPVLLKNVYLRIYEGNDRRVAFLINIGSLDEWSGVRNLVEDTLFNLEELDAVILLSGEVSGIYNSFILADQKFNVRFITDYAVKRQLVEAGCKSGRIRTFGDYPSYLVNLATGHKLRFIPVNFSPSVGSFCLYEEDTGYLFAPEFLSSLYSEKSNDITEEVRLYHRIFMPSGSVLSASLSKVEALKVNMVLPRYGLPYEDFETAVSKLRALRTGIDFIPVINKGRAVHVINQVLEFVLNTEEKEVADRFVEELDRFCLVENRTVIDIYIEPPFTVELLLNTIMLVPGIKPSTIVGVLSILDKLEVFINPF